MEGAGIAKGLPFVGAALSIGGSYLQGKGLEAGYQHEEEKAQQKARAARVAADQTDAALTDELSTTLGNIRAIEAAANIDPSSPTSLAIMQHEQDVAGRAMRIKRGNYMAQAGQSESDAAYYSYAARMALPTSLVGGFASATKSLAGPSSLRTF